MFVIFSIAIPLVMSLVLLGIHIRRPNFRYFWLFAAITALLTWTMIFLGYLRIPQTIPIITWRPIDLFPVSPSLLLDDISWVYSISLVTLLLAVILTAVTRVLDPEYSAEETVSSEWSNWASSLAFISLGLVTTLAGNLITLLLAWAALDLFELSIRIRNAAQRGETDRIVLAFATRIMGIMLVMWAIVSAQSANMSINLNSINPQISVYLVLAAGFRLGVIPVHMPAIKGSTYQQGFGTLIRLLPAASSLMLLGRIASQGMPPQSMLIFIIIASLAALYGAFSWSMSSDEINGQPFWIIGVSALAMASAVQAQTAASLAWGAALLLSGGLIFLYTARDRRLIFIPVLGILGISGLPFTPAWLGMNMYTSTMPVILWAVFIFAQALLINGYFQFMVRPGRTMSGAERFIWVIYPWGLLLLPFVQYIATYLSMTLSTGVLENPPDILASWPSFVASGLAVLLILWRTRGPTIPIHYGNILRKFLSLDWLYGFLERLYRVICRIVTFIDQLVEGKGAVLWTILLLTLLISLLTHIELGE